MNIHNSSNWHSNVSGNSISWRSRAVGCAIILYSLLVVSLVFFYVPLIGMCIGPSLLIITLIGAPIIGLWLGPNWWPRFYARLDALPFLIAMIPGAVAAIFAGLFVIWVGAIYVDGLGYQANNEQGMGAGMTLVAMFILSPLIIVFGPAIGAVGGLVPAFVADRVGLKVQLITWLCGAIGGGIAGLVTGALPYALLWLYSKTTGTPVQ